jgi:MoaA/NifB/PqqE/SkfB family radical SAM enzyme
MYRLRDIRQVHLEITTRCNASCPLCLRNVLGGGVNPVMPIAELTLKDIETIFPKSFIGQLKLMYLCGNYGDPMVAHDTLEVLDYFRRVNPGIRLGIHTNGSGRSPEWWARLARVVDYCRFGIDGLEDTNHLYRRGTRWNKVIESASAFIDAGGRAEWDFIVFRHNEHQVEMARELSHALGFAQFFVKKTYRFINLTAGLRMGQVPTLDRDGNFEYFVEEPESEWYKNDALVQLGRRLEGPASYQTYLEETEIKCRVAENPQLYVSAEGLVFPCCWTANIYPWYQPLAEHGVRRLIDRLPEGTRSLDARVYPLEKIVESSFFQKEIPATWKKSSLAEGKLEVCSRICGTHDLFGAQSTNLSTKAKPQKEWRQQ